MKKKFKIFNKEQQKIIVQVENPSGENLAFIAHGLGGFKEQPHIQVFAETFLKHNFVVIRWDATNSMGESDGEMEDATLTNYYSDLKSILNWAKQQKWYKEPFTLAGHSLGSACCIMFAGEYPRKIKALAPISVFLSGKAYLDGLGVKEVNQWKKKGYLLQKSKSRPGLIKKLNWTLAEDMLKYNLFDVAEKISAPTLLIVGSKDKGTPPKTQQTFYNNLSTKKKELHFIEQAGHTFRDPEHLKEIKEIFNKWIISLDS